MKKTVLVMVDMLKDFMRGGSLAVNDAEDILINVNKLLNKADYAVAVQDWHPPNHKSFARNVDVKPFTEFEGQMRWPDHCVAGTPGSDFHQNITVRNISAVFRKGLNPEVESYSGCYDSLGQSTGLVEYLHGLKFERAIVCGLALDYCVKATADHLAQVGLETFIVTDATKPVDPDYKFMSTAGTLLTTTKEAIAWMEESKAKSP